ncbi:hypothetical protein RDABS01_020587 [Bienertia sinuspersici]
MKGKEWFLPPDIVKAKAGRRTTARRRDTNEHPKDKVKYIRKGIPSKCSNCGSEGHDKRKCSQSIQPTTQPSQGVPEGGSKKGRPKGSKNRVGRNNVPTPAEYLQQIRPSKKSTYNVDPSVPHGSTTWLERTAGERGGMHKGGKKRVKATQPLLVLASHMVIKLNKNFQ